METKEDRPTILIRKAAIGDFEDIFKLAKTLCEFVKLVHNDDVMREKLKEALQSSNSLANYLVAEEIGNTKKIVGYCMYYYIYCSWSGKGAFLEELVVNSNSRRKGVGNALLETCFENIELEGANRVEFVCSDWNKDAIKFYEKYGAINLSTTTSANVFVIERENS